MGFQAPPSPGRPRPQPLASRPAPWAWPLVPRVVLCAQECSWVHGPPRGKLALIRIPHLPAGVSAQLPTLFTRASPTVVHTDRP